MVFNYFYIIGSLQKDALIRIRFLLFLFLDLSAKIELLPVDILNLVLQLLV